MAEKIRLYVAQKFRVDYNDSIQTEIWRRSWNGHVYRMKPDSIPRTALTWPPEGKRKKGRPRKTCRRTVEREICEMGFRTWTKAERIAIDRKRWKDAINGPIFQVGVRN